MEIKEKTEDASHRRQKQTCSQQSTGEKKVYGGINFKENPRKKIETKIIITTPTYERRKKKEETKARKLELNDCRVLQGTEEENYLGGEWAWTAWKGVVKARRRGGGCLRQGGRERQLVRRL